MKCLINDLFIIVDSKLMSMFREFDVVYFVVYW